MRILLVVFACGVLLSCRQDDALPEPSKVKAASTQAVKLESDVVVLNEQELQKGHVVVTRVQTRTIAETVTATGQLMVNQDRTWRLGAVATGRIEGVLVRQGDTVRGGQVLALIHSHEVHEARAAYEEAGLELERARSAARYAHQRWERAKRLLDLRAGSKQEVESAESDLTTTQAQIEKAEAEITKERAHLTDILRVPLPGDEQDGASERTGDSDDIPVVAPAPGIVLERNATAGKVVNTGDELFSVSDISSLWMIAAVGESDVSKLRPGQPVRIAVRAYPGREFRGATLNLGEQFDATTRTLPVRIVVPNPEGLLKPEMFATAALEQTTHAAGIFVPDSAIQEINGISVVFVQESAGHFKTRPIGFRSLSNGETQVTDGLRPNENIVVKGSFLVKSKLLRGAIEE